MNNIIRYIISDNTFKSNTVEIRPTHNEIFIQFQFQNE